MATFNRINKLRFFQILRPHLGEEAAAQFGDALEDEFSPLATRADLDAMFDRLKRDQQTMLIRVTTIWAALLAAAVAIAQLF